jgi:dolichol kinase
MNKILKDELKRKGFHQLLLLYAFGYLYLPKNVVVYGLISAIAIVAGLEFLRFHYPPFNEFFKRNFKGFYRPEEAAKVSGLLGTLMGGLAAILLFSQKEMVFASFLYLAFGDAAAAIVGKTLGRHKIVFAKSLEGTLACFAACLIAGLFLFNLKFALIGAAIAAIVELLPWKINDNFWMQIVNAALLILLSKHIAWLPI